MEAPTAYLIQYGALGHVGRFAAPGILPLARGDSAVIDTPRGRELGRVLAPHAAGTASDSTHLAGGSLVRAATAADSELACEFAEVALGLARRAELLAGAEPLSVLEAEVLFDGSAVVHVLPWADCDGAAWVEGLARESGRPVRLHDAGQTAFRPDPRTSCGDGCGTPSKEGGCSSGGCSTGKCGSGGGCSRGQVSKPDDLRAYFAELRAGMERKARVPLH